MLIEQPTYDPLLTILDHLGAKVRRFERRASRGFRLGLEELERRLTPETRTRGSLQSAQPKQRPQRRHHDAAGG